MAESGVIFKDRTNTGGENEMKNEKAMRPFGIRDKVGYMFGDFGNDFTFLFASTFLMIFYTKVLGIGMGMVGTLFLVARCIDAFTDVTMGQIVDRAKEQKDGRFRPRYAVCAVRWLWLVF